MKKMHNIHGATLVEVLVASALLVLAVTGILISYLRCLELTETARNLSRAIQAAEERMDEIRSTPYMEIYTSYNGKGFSIAGFNGYGVSYVDNSQSDLLVVTVSVSWKQKNGRVYGEDEDLDGVIDSGEDINGNGMLDSSAMLIDRIYQR